MTAHFVSSCIGNDGGGGLNIKPDTASGGYGDNNVSDLINQLETGGLAAQVNSAGQNEPPSNFAPGDIVVFVEPNQQLHVAIYLGNNEIAQHSTTDPNGAIESVNWTGLAGVGISADFYEITSPPSNLQQPIPSSALDGTTGVSTGPTFSWSQVPGNAGYQIIVSTNPADLTPTLPSRAAGPPTASM